MVDPGAEAHSLYDVPGQVDTVFTSHTLEHIPDLACVMACIREKLWAGGRLVAQVPSWRKETLRAENWPHHYHTFTLEHGTEGEWVSLPGLVDGWAEPETLDEDGGSLLMVARKL